MNGVTRLEDAQLLRRHDELWYRVVECQADPEHPASKANGARWKREYERVKREIDRRLARARS